MPLCHYMADSCKFGDMVNQKELMPCIACLLGKICEALEDINKNLNEVKEIMDTGEC